jgi:hypothetical protein
MWDISGFETRGPASPPHAEGNKWCTPNATRNGSILVLKANACNVAFDDANGLLDGSLA